MQAMVFTGRLAAALQISPDFDKAVFRLLEKRGVENAGKGRLVGVICVRWSKGLKRLGAKFSAFQACSDRHKYLKSSNLIFYGAAPRFTKCCIRRPTTAPLTASLKAADLVQRREEDGLWPA